MVDVEVVDDDDATAQDDGDATVTITPAVVIGENLNNVPTSDPTNPTTTRNTTTTLPETGAGVTDLIH